MHRATIHRFVDSLRGVSSHSTHSQGGAQANRDVRARQKTSPLCA
ncbi:hypothetical protein DB30_04009 [Enhygromyxa salina]|uniref:Uncharacterized protein n=1 Tax=Enhygromyxa salina TaxID=215803 RepID=A0A0C2DAC2_9BACT|nr:hypothetical protein DB30_04009 [Enhygromyxa salina]